MSETSTGWPRAALVTGACALLLALGACSSDEGEQGGETASAPASASATPEGEPTPGGQASGTPTPSATVSEAPASPSATPAPSASSATADPSATAETPAAPTPTPSATTSSTPPPPPASSSGPADTASAACSTNDLRIAVDTEEGAAGSTYYSVVMTNGGDSTCAISGYPSISFAGADGSPIGAAATPASDLPGTGQTLQPGDSTEAILRSTQADLYGDTCQKQSATGLRITAPGDDSSLTVSFPLSACGNPEVQQLSVSQVGAGL